MSGSNGRIEKNVKQGSDNITAARLLELLKRNKYRCALTGRALAPETASADHILPIKRGGAHRMSNIQILDAQVDQAKGTMTQEEFLAMCREVVEHANS